MTISEQHPYPEQLPPCLQGWNSGLDTSETFGQPCLPNETLGQPCPASPQAKCGYLALSRQLDTMRKSIVGAEEMNGLLLADNAELLAEQARRECDRVIPDFHTHYGAVKLLETDLTFAEEFEQDAAGALYADIRGLHWADGALGDEHHSGDERGDHMLIIAAARMRAARGAVRLGPGTPPEDRPEERQNPALEERQNPALRDVGFRGGERSDELVVVVRQVNTLQLNKVADRARNIFSPEQAIKDSREGRVPIVASLASAHVAELKTIDRDTPHEAFDATYRLASLKHNGAKTAQYARMKELIRETANEQGISVAIPTEQRDIIAVFYEICCPHFWANTQAAFDREMRELTGKN